MYYSEIKQNDVANGEGVSTSLFVSGCENFCKNCFNKETWDFKYGKEFTEETMDYILQCINKNGIQRNFSVLGGDPLHPKNLPTVLEILSKIKETYPGTTTYVWTGYLYEDLLYKHGDIFRDIDVLIDGKFVEELKDITLHLRGSKNQRIIRLH